MDLNYKFYSEDLISIKNVSNYVKKIGKSSENFFIIPKNSYIEIIKS